ncbi:MAG: glycine--tRNA ligase subunit beta [Terriglobales bacterium]
MPENCLPLLIEIGCEELPAGAVAALALAFKDHLNRRLAEADLGVGEMQWTPRRLLFFAPELRLRQPESEELVVGPPARTAYASDGQLSHQGLGFAAKNQTPPEALFRLTNAKGEYVALKKKSGGAAAAELLLRLIPGALDALPLPRSMTWGPGTRFLRPVRWLLALHGAEVIPFQWAGLTASRESRGHRTLGAARFPVSNASEFPALWKTNFVLTSPQDRFEAITKPLDQLRQLHDPALEDTLVNLTEWPTPLVGSFEAAYLRSLPPEVLVTVMRDHQKYFAVEDQDGQLAPKFVAIINQSGDPQGLIRHGHERVLRARFSDAQFFFDTDRKRPLRDRLPLLDQVTFQAKLGSYGAKARRLEALAGLLGGDAAAQQAALLAKCDLTSEMVKEFPELQGIMGGHYARADGLSEAIAQAIADQYCFDKPSRTLAGALVSLADKLDTVAGMFALGEIPSGSADPFALRRAGNGVVRTLVEREMPFSLQAAARRALDGYGSNAEFHPAEEVLAALAAFFEERLSFYLRDVLSATPQQSAAVLASGADDPLDAARRLHALRAAPDLAAVAAVVKRARSIVRKEGALDLWKSQPLADLPLSVPAAVALRDKIASLAPDLGYASELARIAALAAPLERFFNEVRVNDPDPALRAQRLALLSHAVARLLRIADFAELAVG